MTRLTDRAVGALVGSPVRAVVIGAAIMIAPCWLLGWWSIAVLASGLLVVATVRRARLRFWLAALDLARILGAPRSVYLWILRRASNATDWGAVGDEAGPW